MALDATNVYWTECGDPAGGYVRKVPKAGGEVVTLATGDRLSGIAVDSTSVYWVAGTSDATGGTIMKIPVGGGTPTTMTSRSGLPSHLAVDGSSVYWVEQMQDAIMSIPLSGGVPAVVVTARLAWQFALTPTDVYWLGIGLNRAPIAGGAPVALTSSTFPAVPIAGLAVSATTVYFGSGPPFGAGVSEVPVQGGAVSVLAASPQSSSPGGPVAIDASRAYWGDLQGVYTVSLAGGAATTLASGQDNVIAVAVDATRLYWLVNGNGTPGSVKMLPLAALGGG
jgi:hypothetical protein